ncbi:hypothetical protein OG203_11285 [Nocardia sp. NBC_01499]|uniref:hypothetical protein n=1 Tax=Nocardia sp. NBC_01499 TaxID=2903597 RepID=UPI0038646D3C
MTAHGLEQYLAHKHALTPTGDPVEDLRRGWDSHTEFGLTHPAFYVLIYGSPQPGHRPAAGAEAYRLLVGQLDRVAAAGRLRMPPEQAARLIHAANTGVTLSLIATPSGERDPDLSPRTREIALAAIATSEEVDTTPLVSALPLPACRAPTRCEHCSNGSPICGSTTHPPTGHFWLDRDDRCRSEYHVFRAATLHLTKPAFQSVTARIPSYGNVLHIGRRTGRRYRATVGITRHHNQLRMDATANTAAGP